MHGGCIMIDIHQAKKAATSHPLISNKIKNGWIIVGFYEYRDSEAKPLYWKIRLDLPDSNEPKYIRPFHFNGKEWICAEPDFYKRKKSLYRLPELLINP